VSGSPRVCVIGAGSSGLPVLKALQDRGLPFVCYEKSDRVGGNWVFGNKNGMSAAYRSLHINTSRDRMEYRDLPMPADYPDFPHHSLIAAYFEQYVARFDLARHIRFERGVAHARRRPEGGWDITTDDGVTERFDALAVANGHHWDPQWPDPPFPGHFDGPQLHAHAYVDPKEPHDLVDKRVVVVGMGNSAMDIACELSQRGVARQVFLSARRGAHVVPHYLLGRPLDQIISAVPPWVPFKVRQGAGALIHRVSVGRMTRYGLPEPDHQLGQAHPTISSEILPRLGRGDITPKPNLRQLDGDHVLFEDGTREPVDAIVYCTGYKVSFPFFDPDFLSAPGNELPLFFRVFAPDLPDLFFVGLLQPLGAIMPLAEAQAKWVAEYLCGEYALPDPAGMRAEIEAYRRSVARRYVPSRRHTMQVDFDDYLFALKKEQARGRARAGRGGPWAQLTAKASSWARRTRY
jgi:dimethylaniline monooxygenase (N-oxide forming)